MEPSRQTLAPPDSLHPSEGIVSTQAAIAVYEPSDYGAAGRCRYGCVSAYHSIVKSLGAIALSLRDCMNTARAVRLTSGDFSYVVIDRASDPPIGL